jgi:hypothetical protein
MTILSIYCTEEDTPPVMICEGHVARKKQHGVTWMMAMRDSPCGRAWSVPEFLAHMAPCGFRCGTTCIRMRVK